MEMLQVILNHVIPQLKLKKGFLKTIFQQGGAPADTSNRIIALLNPKFSERL